MVEPQTAVSPWLGLISVAYWWMCWDDWLPMYPPLVQDLWFQQRQTGRLQASGLTLNWGENWRVSHSEGILESLITGTITPNQPATLKQCLSKVGGGNSALLTGNQWSPPQSSQTKDGRATDSCFALIGAHQCGVLMDVLGWLAAYVSTTSTRLVVSTKADREATVIRTDA